MFRWLRIAIGRIGCGGLLAMDAFDRGLPTAPPFAVLDAIEDAAKSLVESVAANWSCLESR
jgi:hypothetical protein